MECLTLDSNGGYYSLLDSDTELFMIIKDKKFRIKRNKKIVKKRLIIFSISIINAAIIVTFLLILAYNYGNIISVYKIFNENETIQWINIYEDADENKDDIKYFVTIGDEEFKQEKTNTFERPDSRTITFVFKNRLTSLSILFKENDCPIEANFSQLEAEEITYLQRTFFQCKN